MSNYKYIPTQELLNHNSLTYQEILNLKKRLNGYSKSQDAGKALEDFEWHDEYKLTPEHTEKGLAWLYDRAFKPSKLAKVLRTKDWTDEDLRVNSPFGWRELSILVNFDHFTFAGFYDATISSYALDQGLHNYLPLWRTYDKDGDSFEYYVQSGDMQIIG